MSCSRNENWPGRLPHPPGRPGHALAHPYRWSGELAQDLRAAARRFRDAQRNFVNGPTPVSAASLLEAILELVDLGDLTGHEPSGADRRARIEVGQ